LRSRRSETGARNADINGRDAGRPASRPIAAKAFIDFLQTPASKATIAAKGMKAGVRWAAIIATHVFIEPQEAGRSVAIVNEMPHFKLHAINGII
jgi:hypothetical protein